MLIRQIRRIHLSSIQNATKSERPGRIFKLKTGWHGMTPVKDVSILNEDDLEELKYEKIRFARHWENDSLFYDDDYERYLRRMMRDGRRGVMYRILHDFCYEVKCKQFTRMRKKKEKEASGKAEKPLAEEKDIDLDPISIFKSALENGKPQVITKKVKRGGATYQVPFPLTSEESDWYVMRWFNDTLKDRPRPRTKHYSEALAEEMILASQGLGKIVKMRDDVHRLAQANKAYSHYRWG